MGTREGFTGADEGAGGGFMELLESRDVHGLAMGEDFMHPSAFSTDKPSRMLCFGGGRAESGSGFQKLGVTGSDSSSTSSSCSGGSSFYKLRMQTEGIGEDGKAEQKRRSGSGRKACKKTKTEAPVKARKEKIGERIVALQQLVSPFGKTDTTSVLHEAMGYIRFLHEQVQVLSSPYLQRLPSSGGEGAEEGRYELRSRGLCLVPVESTVHVASNNGADFWSPAMAMAMGSSNSSSSNR